MKFNKNVSLLLAVSMAAFLAACGGGGSGGGGSTGTNTDTNTDTDSTVDLSPADCTSDGGTVTLTGTVLFEDVPVKVNVDGTIALDYDNTVQKPVREAEMYVECGDQTEVFAETVTGTDGTFSVSIPDGVEARVVVRAKSVRSGGPTWDVEVVDNTDGKAVWTLMGERFTVGSDDMNVDVVAGSGWGGTSYTGGRIGGAFSIYDTIYNAMQMVRVGNPTATFAPLALNWSPNNNAGCSGTYPYADGCVSSSFFTAREIGGSIVREIYIVGKENSDTDEYDDSVVAHEWGHYYEDWFSRSDSVGGRHTGGDALDIRVAFGEGWGNAVSGMITGLDKYTDTRGAQQEGGFDIGLEAELTSDEGWWNETSVQMILFDLFDSNDDQSDTVSLGFGPLHDVLVNDQRTTEAFTSIFSMAHYMVQSGAISLADMDSLLSDHDIGSIPDIYGSGRTNTAPADNDGRGFDSKYSIPVYLDLNDAVNSGVVRDICVTKIAGEYNKLGSRRFGTFQVNAAGTYRFALDGRTVPDAVEGSDPDMYLYDNGTAANSGQDLFDGSGGDWSSPDATAADNPDKGAYGDSVEVAEATLETGKTYVMDLHEWMNHDAVFTDDGGTTGGPVCLELTVTMP